MAAADPIRIVPLRDYALEAPVLAPNLTYRGGPLLSAPPSPWVACESPV